MKDSTLVRQNSKFKISHKIRRKSCFEFKMKAITFNILVIINFGQKSTEKKKSDPNYVHKNTKIFFRSRSCRILKSVAKNFKKI